MADVRFRKERVNTINIKSMKLQMNIITFMIVFSQLSFAQNPKEGKYTFKNGAVYKGELVKKLPCGKGRTTFPNGDVYEGEYVNGKRQGKGIYQFSDGEKYEGEWFQDQQHGKGVYVFSNGDKYDGQWFYDYMQGQGIYTWADGTYFQGSWKSDQKNGEGTFCWPDGSVYSGSMKNDMREGVGSYKYANGDMYEGEWKDDMINGRGAYTFKNGDKYEGEYVSGKRHGQGIGTFTWPDGSSYVGGWFQDQPHGYGKYTTSDGVIYETEWCHGVSKEKFINDIPNEETPKAQDKETTSEDIWEFIHQISYNGNLVSEKTKDEAFEAPTSLLTGKRWVFNSELSCWLNYPYIFETFHVPQSGMITFKADRTFTTERIIKYPWGIWKVTYSGDWTRFKHEFISMKPNPLSVKVECIEYYREPYQQLSARLKSEVNDKIKIHIKSIQKEIRYRLSPTRTNSYSHKSEKNPDYIKYPENAGERMERLDNEFLILGGTTYVNETKLREIYERRPKLSKKEMQEKREIRIPAKASKESIPYKSTRLSIKNGLSDN